MSCLTLAGVQAYLILNKVLPRHLLLTNLERGRRGGGPLCGEGSCGQGAQGERQWPPSSHLFVCVCFCVCVCVCVCVSECVC